MRKFMRIYVRVLSLVVVMAMVLVIPAVEADNDNKVTVTSENAEQILLEFGADQEMIDIMSEDEKLSMAYAVITNPELVQMISQEIKVDEFAAINKICNYTDKDFIENGYTQDEITEVKEQINILKSMNDAEIIEQTGFEQKHVDRLRVAMELTEEQYTNYKSIRNTDAVDKKDDLDDGTIHLWFNLFPTTAMCTPVCYNVQLMYSWDGFVWFKENDQIGISWGGEIDATNYRCHAAYQGVGISSMYDNVVERYYNDPIKIFPQAGVLWEFPFTEKILDGPYTRTLQFGSASCWIYQNVKENKATTVTATYAHQTLSITGAGISVSSNGVSASLSVSAGYNEHGPLWISGVKY